MQAQFLEVRDLDGAAEFALKVPKIKEDIYVMYPRDSAMPARVTVLEQRCELRGLLTDREWIQCRLEQIMDMSVSIAETFFRLRDAGKIGRWIDLRGGDPQAALLVDAKRWISLLTPLPAHA